MHQREISYVQCGMTISQAFLMQIGKDQHTQGPQWVTMYFLEETLFIEEKEARYSSRSSVLVWISSHAQHHVRAWVQNLFSGLHLSPTSPLRPYYDNKKDIHIAKNLVFHRRTKYMEADCHLVRHKMVDDKLSILQHVSQVNQLVGLLTKPLGGSQMQFICIYLQVCTMYMSILRGGGSRIYKLSSGLCKVLVSINYS